MSFFERSKELPSYYCVTYRVIVLNDPEGSKKIKLRLMNKSEIKHCCIKTSDLIEMGETCDFVIDRSGSKLKVLLELKGDGNKRKAVSQINSTWNYLRENFPGEFEAIIAIIVTDKSPTTNLFMKDLLKLKDNCMRNGGAFYDVKSDKDFELN